MSQKRKHAEFADGEQSARRESRKKPFKGGKDNSRPYGKRSQAQIDPDAASTNALKNRIRDLKRLLHHVDGQPKHKMPAGVRIERERELEACEHELVEKRAATQEVEKRRKMISKYHQVRFFDRQKATRILKQLKRQLSSHAETESSIDDTLDVAELREKIHRAEVAVNYAIYYPLSKPYSSLYPRSKSEKDESKDDQDNNTQQSSTLQEAKGDPHMWKTVEQAMEQGTLDKLRNSDSTDSTPRTRERDDERNIKSKSGKQKTGGRGMARHAQKATSVAHDEDEDEESDGGFFV